MTPRRVKDVLWALALAGLVAAILRLWMGLGATTDLSDGVPWGLWKVLNMIAGVALATGGFVLAFTVHVLGVKSLKPLLRPALLVAFLGYGSSCTALLMDIGLPHRFWHPMVFWNEHSFLFEVFWCVLLYFTITVIEVSPIALEESKYGTLRKWIKRISTPAVVLGITLSTMHHTTLGSMFLVSPSRLHEIWYSPWLPILFILSAMGAGILTVALLTLLASRLYRKVPPMAALTKAASAGAVILAIYLVVRVVDLTVNGGLAAAFSGAWEGNLFLVEILSATVLPIVLIAIPKVRRSPGGLIAAGLFAASGLILNRLGVGIFGYLRSGSASYSPTAAEIFLTLGIPAAGGLVFLWFVEKFRVLDIENRVEDPECRRSVTEFDPQTSVWRGAFLDNLERVSLLFVIVVPIAMGMFLGNVAAAERKYTPVHPPAGADNGRKVLRIDGDRNGKYVLFPHDTHRQHLGGEESCALCHHMDLPGDRYASCHTCHQDMKLSTSIFDHDFHTQKVAARAGHTGKLAGNHSCDECHEAGKPRSGETAKACHECHQEDMRMPEDSGPQAIGYVRALHASCVTCHEEKGRELDRPILSECGICHQMECDREDLQSERKCTSCHE
ncbi:MAG: NrfD/PsrC family molybdoenzyme membrane anchor subunit [Planctomycetota bacterium]